MFSTTILKPFGVLIEAKNDLENLHKINLKKLKNLLYKNHLLILRGFQNFESSEKFSQYCALWGEIALWPFGKVLELKEHKNPKDHIFDNSYVPLHWDGMYRPQVPELQIFHCALAPEEKTGGETTFSNTVKVLEKSQKKEYKLWSQVTGVYQRKMDFYHSKTVAPIITKHPTKNFPVIRYCEPPKTGDQSFINHPDLDFTGIERNQIESFQSNLHKALYHPENFYAHKWQTGDLVISNNHTLLHGRKAFSKGSARYLRRVHIIGDTSKTNPHLVSHQ